LNEIRTDTINKGETLLFVDPMTGLEMLPRQSFERQPHYFPRMIADLMMFLQD
jgi:hypothetical protein